MTTQLTPIEALQALIDGKKIQSFRRFWDTNYIEMTKDGQIYDDKETYLAISLESFLEDKWKLYEEPVIKKKVTYYRVITNFKGINLISDRLFKNEIKAIEHFKQDDFKFVRLLTEYPIEIEE